MAQLTDFEELLSKVVNPLIKDYMREAMVCYNTGAYRGCIVMSYIALFDDFVDKLAAIRDVNADAKAIFIEVEKRRKAQDVYEHFLLEQLASKSLISELDSSTVDLIRQRRNKSAHPSGHHPSAEEARFIFFEVIDKFLSKDTLGTKHIVDEILSRLGDAKFFTSSSISDTEETVKHEIKHLHEEASPYLVIKLTELYKSSSGISKKNASFFLDGLACLDNNKINNELVTRLLDKSMGDEEMYDKCMTLLASNPKIFELLSKLSQKRFRSILNERLDEIDDGKTTSSLNDPSIFIKRLLERRGAHYVLENFKDQIECLIVKIPFRKRLIKELIAESENCLIIHFNNLRERAGSYDFQIANDFIDRFYDIESAIVELLSGSQCFSLVIEIIGAAKNGAWRSGEIVESKFALYPALKAKALDHLGDCDDDEALKMINKRLANITNVDRFVERYLEEASQPST